MICHSEGRANEERWNPIPGYESRYEVSDRGRVRSLVSRAGRRKTPLVMKHKTSRGGYKSVGLVAERDARQRFVGVHCLVLMAFVGPRPLGATGSHLNGDVSDNRLANLMWESHADNCSRRTAHGTQQRGSRCHNARLSESDVRAIRASNESNQDLADRFGVTPSCVWSVRARRSWKHVA